MTAFAGQLGPVALTMPDALGRPTFATAYNVTLTGTLTPATVYTNRLKAGGTTTPGLVTDDKGYAKCFLDPGTAAYDVYAGTGPGGTKILTGVSVGQDAADAKTVALPIPLTDETSSITTGTAKATYRMPFAMALTEIRGSVNTASSSGLPTFDVKNGGTSVFSTLLTIDANEKSSTTAATPAVISTPALADDAEITVDITVAGTGAKGAKLYLIGTRS